MTQKEGIWKSGPWVPSTTEKAPTSVSYSSQLQWYNRDNQDWPLWHSGLGEKKKVAYFAARISSGEW